LIGERSITPFLGIWIHVYVAFGVIWVLRPVTA
jgi:hypothetical protein